MNEYFGFIKSPRFWQLFLVGLAGGLIVAYPESRLVIAFATATGIWFGGSVAVRTIDRSVDAKADAIRDAAGVEKPEGGV